MDDLIGEFIAETSESLIVLDGELARLAQNPGNTDIIGNVSRLVHTIKGTCGFLGLPRLEAVAEATENALEKFQNGTHQLTAAMVPAITLALTRIRELVEALATTGKETAGEDGDVRSALQTLGSASSTPAARPTPKPAAKRTPKLAMINTNAPEEKPVPRKPESEAPAAKEPTAKTPALSQQVKEKAIKQGLETTAEDRSNAIETDQQPLNHELTRTMTEAAESLGLLRHQLRQLANHQKDGLLDGPIARLTGITSALEYGVLKTRMQPVGAAWAALPRQLRALGTKLGKKIELTTSGEKCLLGRELVDGLKTALTTLTNHLCEEWAETPEVRRTKGQRESATITLAAHEESGLIHLTLQADIEGVDLTALKKRIATTGDIPAEELGDDEALRTLFTRSEEGKKLPQVKHAIEAMGGSIRLAQQQGSITFHLTLPPTRALAPVTLVRAGSHRIALPQYHIAEIIPELVGGSHRIEQMAGLSLLRLRGQVLPLIRLATLLGEEGSETSTAGSILVLRVGTGEIGLVVDAVEETQKLRIAPLGKMLRGIALYSGCAVTAEGTLALVLNPNALADKITPQAGTTRTAPQIVTIGSGLSRGASFLLVKAGSGNLKAIPLDLVSRLETVDAATIAHTGITARMPYQGDHLAIEALPGGTIPQTGGCKLVLFQYDGTTTALAVDQVVDIVAAPVTMVMHGEEGPYLGSVMIEQEMVEVVNIAPLLTTHKQTRRMKPAGTTAPHVLLVEENFFFRMLLAPLFTAAGWRVTEAENPDHAYALLKQQPRLNAIMLSQQHTSMIGRLHQLGYSDTPVLAYQNTPTAETDTRPAGIAALLHKTDRPALLEALEQYGLKEQHA